MNGDNNKKAKVTCDMECIMDTVRRRDGSKKEFIQCAHEILESLEPLFERDPSLLPIIERLMEPERVIQFRVAWVDDQGRPQVNRGWRVQYSSAIGPYKGGLRFHPSVNNSVSRNHGRRCFQEKLTQSSSCRSWSFWLWSRSSRTP